MVDLAKIVVISQEMGERTIGQMHAADSPAGGELAYPAANVAPTLLTLQRAHRPEFEKEKARDRGLLLVDMELAVRDPMADAASHSPFFFDAAILSGMRGRDLSFELSEGQQHVERQPTLAGRGVERLGHRYEADAVRVERFHQLGEIGERACRPIDL